MKSHRRARACAIRAAEIMQGNESSLTGRPFVDAAKGSKSLPAVSVRERAVEVALEVKGHARQRSTAWGEKPVRSPATVGRRQLEQRARTKTAGQTASQFGGAVEIAEAIRRQTAH